MQSGVDILTPAGRPGANEYVPKLSFLISA